MTDYARPRGPLSKPIPVELASDMMETIMRGITKEPDGCWVRTAGVNPVTGYTAVPRMVDGNRTYFYAHRVSYVFHNGPIPNGYTIDHLCEVPACCNPDHLRAVPHRENVLRSKNNPTAINARKTHCPEGHPLVAIAKNRRGCPICAPVVAKARRLARKAQGVPEHESHGTQRSYHFWSCRCAECKAWQRANYLAKKAAA